MRHLIQPEGSSLCGQTCVAMAADVSLLAAIEAVGHERLRGTHTKEVVGGLRKLGVECAARMKRVSKKLPVMPKRCMVAITKPESSRRKTALWHWMLLWDGQMYDPAGKWPSYNEWVITSYLEILS